MIIITKAMKSKSKKQFQRGVRIGFLPAIRGLPFLTFAGDSQLILQEIRLAQFGNPVILSTQLLKNICLAQSLRGSGGHIIPPPGSRYIDPKNKE